MTVKPTKLKDLKKPILFVCEYNKGIWTAYKKVDIIRMLKNRIAGAEKKMNELAFQWRELKHPDECVCEQCFDFNTDISRERGDIRACNEIMED